MAFGRPSAVARPLTAAEMSTSVALMAGGAGLVGWGWAVGHVYAVGVGVLAIMLTPMRMLQIQGDAGPFDALLADD